MNKSNDKHVRLEYNMKIVVYSAKESSWPMFDKIQEELGIELVYCEDSPSYENVNLAMGVEAICIITTPMDGSLVEAFYDVGVRFISTRTAGYDHIDIEKAKELGMGVGHSTYSPHNVAEYALMMMLMATRNVTATLKDYKKQDYTLANREGLLLQSMTVGVVGTGKIGSTVIKMLSGFGCEILAYDPYENEKVKEYVLYVDFDELIAKSDIITLHLPLNDESEYMINAETIENMKAGVIIVNTARGKLIDTDALIDGLKSRKVGYATLDVIENESLYYYQSFVGKPVPLKHIEELSKFDNVLLTPHVAFLTDKSFVEMTKNGLKSCILEMEEKENPWRVL